MSALPAPVARRSPTPALRPQLQVAAPRRRQAGHIAYLGVCIGLVVAALVTMLILHTATSSAAYESFRINQELAQLETRRSTTQESLSKLGAPAALEGQARELGMVPAHDPLFINLRDGSIIGTWPDQAEEDQAAAGQDGQDQASQDQARQDQAAQETP